MKKEKYFGFFWMTVVLASVPLTVSGCQGKLDIAGGSAKIEPYKLSEKEKELLQEFGIEEKARLFSFRAPREAVSVELKLHQRREGGDWEDHGGGSIGRGPGGENEKALEGMLAVQALEDYAFRISVTADGRSSITTEPVELEGMTTSTWQFLEESQEISLNQEIPVAVFLYDDGSQMRSGSLEEYFDPEGFAGVDFVQVVTVEFSDYQ